MSDLSKGEGLVPFGISIRGQVDPGLVKEFYKKAFELSAGIGALSARQDVRIIFNPEQTAELPIIPPSLEGVEFNKVEIAGEELRRQLKEVGAMFRARREEMRLSQSEVERRAGVSQTHISMLERGHHGQPEPGALYRLAAALDLPLELIMSKAGYEIIESTDEADIIR